MAEQGRSGHLRLCDRVHDIQLRAIGCPSPTEHLGDGVGRPEAATVDGLSLYAGSERVLAAVPALAMTRRDYPR
jgi:hypothetical protein